MNITVVGTGYVGLSNAVLFARHHSVTSLDIDTKRVELLNQGMSPIADEYIEKYLKEENLDLKATCEPSLAYSEADYIIIATPTNYDSDTNYFDTSSIESVIAEILPLNTKAVIIIKSTIPVGYTSQIKEKFKTEQIIFSPEFLREGKALYDNLYPSRIIVGEKSERAEKIAQLYLDATIDQKAPTLCMESTEAEAVKLFSNTYLAMRVAYFNELDTYCAKHSLNSQDIVQGVSLDPRIGQHYNNPSFGYGGYCLPKDTKQLLANYKDVPQNLIQAIIHSNKTRKEFITKEILKKRPNVVGVYRLTMKANSDNFRDSAIQDIIRELEEYNIKVVIFEPTLNVDYFEGYTINNDLNLFLSQSDVILANRLHADLAVAKEKVYTRDLFGVD
ncbi:nucleotide sugar dehydrogenase [Acinetobacter haemolyticus]|uniref:nucleotide sugar dehydrogenase n=1 Tax=Acinetobacter haemolyticus TaxID=29430 RepID=UPI001331C436|nr:nucleotide sugar dehydrogenase [Acinetobacter haemolyticus]NAR57755.1 nucleotide sugar dehydrogenase [Acinetobacter haemolyticus]NAS01970.1 nucleotide sugar dehydrogenase [Acinetobacter haemolyticus]QHI34097.1 nucleotide sugar dehydrogenase [Acinetobacter haemolyticus]